MNHYNNGILKYRLEGGKRLATKLKRFTISIPLKMETALDSVKQRRYYRDTQNDMIRDLIIRGLAALEADEDLKFNKCGKK